MTVHVGSTFNLQRLHKRWSFPLTKSAGNCGFCHICERNRYWKTSFFVQWKCLQITKVTLLLFKLWTCYIVFINLFQFIYKKFLFTTVILSSFLLLSESISEWVKDIKTFIKTFSFQNFQWGSILQTALQYRCATHLRTELLLEQSNHYFHCFFKKEVPCKKLWIFVI